MNKKYDNKVNNLVDKVYVLTVKTFHDRISHIQNEMQNHNIDFQFIFDFDIPEINEEIENIHFHETSSLTMGQKSLVLKHIQAWKNAEKNNYQRILVFEDDVVLKKNFAQEFEKIIAATKEKQPGYLVFLGGSDAKVPESFLLSKDIITPLPISTAEGYLTDREAIIRRINWQKNNKISLPADHLISKIDKDLGITNYWSKKPIVEQGSVTGIFNSHLDNHRQKHSKFFNISRYHWNKFQRRFLKAQIAKIRKIFL